MKIHRLTLGLALLPLMAGCSAVLRPAGEFPALAEPIGQLTARTQAAAPPDVALERALQAKAAAMLAKRTPSPAGSPLPQPTAPLPVAGAQAAAPPAAARPPAAPLPGGAAGPARKDAVSAMLARARQISPSPAANRPALAEPQPAKIQARLSDPLPAKAGAAATIIFATGRDDLDGDGNRALAELSRRTGLESGRKLVLTAGLSGTAPAWERLQLASRRLEVVARHVPPPLAVDRRFDPALDGNVIKVTIAGEGS
ncbi:hypothetical protein [Rhabdaerophilum sp. SD176]|uniref:hypothetical protein n=1 Tax=Rhabdaerophilum sp. SD176 TaxID=2983548 RepID=UPI0024DFFEC0|nr:hypothetical protein [Rhabdaerophilum sp. SD176]